MNSNERLVLLGLENVDGSLSGPLQVIDVLAGMSVKAMGDEKERGVVRASMSDAGVTIGSKNYDLSLPVELKGGGLDAGVVQAPPLGPALQACGMVVGAAAMVTVSGSAGTWTAGEELTNTTAGAPLGRLAHYVTHSDGSVTLWVYDLQNDPSAADVITGSTSAATGTTDSIDDALCYRLVSDRAQHATCQIHTYLSQTRRITRKAQGTFQLAWKAGESASVQFTFKGLYTRPTDETLPDADYNDLLPPIGENAGLTIEGYPAAEGTIESFDLQLGNEVVPVPDINSPHGRHSFRIQKRKVTGSLDPEVLALSTFNPFELWEAGTRVPIHCTLGNAPGYRVSTCVTAAQLLTPDDKERAGNDVYALPFRATGSNDDELFMFFH